MHCRGPAARVETPFSPQDVDLSVISSWYLAKLESVKYAKATVSKS